MTRTKKRSNADALMALRMGGLLSCLLANVAVAYVPSASVSCHQSRRSSPGQAVLGLPGRPSLDSSTALSMGLRSFIKRKILHKDDDDDDDDEESYSSSTEVPEARIMDDILDDEEEDEGVEYIMEDDEEVGDMKEESIQERIVRVKSGYMTDDEKQAFLNAAMTRKSVQISGDSKPIRQSVPQSMTASAMKRSRTPSASPKSPYPTDALWNRVIRGETKETIAKGASDMRRKTEDDSAKRKYLEMVTNPDRFSAYKVSSGGTTSTGSIPTTEAASDVLQNLNQAKKKLAEEQRLYESGTVPGGVATDYFASTQNLQRAPRESQVESSSDESRNDLASRLEATAYAQEQRDVERKRALEELRFAEQARLAKERQERDDALLRKEREIMEHKRLEKEKRDKQHAEVLEREEERRKQLQAAQDEYWENKLDAEKKARVAALSTDEKDFEEEVANQYQELEKMKAKHALEEEADRVQLREEERAREGPHEGDILKEAAEHKSHDQELVNDIIDRAAAKAAKAVSSEPVSTGNKTHDFIVEQARKKAEMDRVREQQTAQLASLSSPLPSRAGGAPVMSPAVQINQQVATRKPATSASALSDLTNLVSGNSAQPVVNNPTPSPPPVAPRLNLADLTRLKPNSAQSANVARTPAPAPAPAAPRLNLADLTRLKKDDGQSPPSQTKRPVRMKVDSGAANKPIRQRVSTSQDDDDDDDDEDEGYTRNGPNKNMSISDAMKKSNSGGGGGGGKNQKEKESQNAKAKKWGIDIDKFR